MEWAAIKRWAASWWDPAVLSEAPRGWGLNPAPLSSSGDKTRDEIAHGEAADRLLNDELLVWVLGEMRRRAHNSWEDCSVTDIEQLQLLRLRIDVLKEFVAHLQALATNGRIAQQMMADEERRREQERVYGRGLR